MDITPTNKQDPEKMAQLSHFNVLLVNDDPISLGVLEAIFSMRVGLPPSNIKMAYNGLEAYKMSINTQFDLVIMDVNMPVMSGPEATAKIKNFFLASALNGLDPEVLIGE